ncbi:MAG: hypothetical protein MUF42_02200 [Cytophagaceae bacterium]|jgi:hypothetical protein|nr:hypothetical protein [Cytophagaceae bacterium]
MATKFLVAGILVFIFVPILQQSSGLVPVEDLYGAYEKAKKPTCTLDSLYKGAYQNSIEKWCNENFGFRNTLVRFHNQLGFWLYKKSYTNNVTVGKEDYLFDISYINAYTGADYAGEEELRNRVSIAKKLQDSLRAHGIQLLFVLAPGKASFFPEYIPDKYLNNRIPGNYETIRKLFLEKEINHIDFRKWFAEKKATSPYPLFPKCGIHWSVYGATLAADSMLRKIEQLTDTPLNRMTIDSIMVSNQLREVDQDVGKGMNLLWEINSYPMAYPVVSYSTLEKKLKVLTVADSYYWTMPLLDFKDKVFEKNNFLYYNKQLYVNNGGDPYSEEKINRARLILGHDVIIVMATDANLGAFGWNFFENTYNGLFDLKSKAGNRIPLPIAILMNDVQYDPTLLKSAKEKSERLKIPLDSAIHLNALQIGNQKK